jgi:hypothetical protein
MKLKRGRFHTKVRPNRSKRISQLWRQQAWPFIPKSPPTWPLGSPIAPLSAAQSFGETSLRSRQSSCGTYFRQYRSDSSDLPASAFALNCALVYLGIRPANAQVIGIDVVTATKGGTAHGDGATERWLARVDRNRPCDLGVSPAEWARSAPPIDQITHGPDPQKVGRRAHTLDPRRGEAPLPDTSSEASLSIEGDSGGC